MNQRVAADCYQCPNRKTCLFDCLDEDSKKYLNQHKTTRRFKGGQYIYREGFSASDLAILQEGVIKLVRHKEGNGNCVIDLKNKTNIIGLESIIEGGKYESSAIAFTQVTICILNKTIIHRLSHQVKCCKYLSNVFVSSIKGLFDRILDQSGNSSEIKLKKALLLLYNCMPETKENGLVIKRDELAEIAGLSRETVSRTLTILKKKKFIQLQNSSIFLLHESSSII